MKLQQAKLLYDKNQLAPVKSKETIDYHYGTLYKSYVDRYNKSEGDADFNESGAFLHDIYFTQFQSPSSANRPTGTIAEFIVKHHQTFDNFKTKVEKTAMTIQGSGWVYLAKDGKIKTIANHAVKKDIVLLIDWWEHAWALDYQADKLKYLENIWKIIDWNVISGKVGLVQEQLQTDGNFIKQLHEARLIRDRADLKYSYTEICEFLYLVILTLDFLSRLKEGRQTAERYARLTASYINYTEFRVSATDLYNFIYFVQAEPDIVQLLFGNEDSKKLRMKTQIPRMELNRWLMKVADLQSRDLYFFMRMEQALSISNSELKDIRRILAFQNPTASDLRMVSARIMNFYRQKIPTLDFRFEVEQVLSGGKYTYIK